MCLDYMDDKPTILEGTGYKLFRLVCGELKELFDRRHPPFKRRRWTTDPKDILLTTDCTPQRGYRTGYHIFLHKKDTIDYYFLGPSEVYEVKFRNVVATGANGNREIVVAREILIKGKQ